MARTLSDLVAEARSFVQDSATPYRYEQSDVALFLNSALAEARRLRPDAFVGVTDTPTFTEAQLDTEDFPIDDQFFHPVAEFIAGNLELRDDEFSVEGRAVAFLKLFRSKLMGTNT